MTGNVRNRAAGRIVVATTGQLAAAGLSRYRMGRLVERGKLLAIRRGVYALPREDRDAMPGHATQVAAVFARCDFPAVASHRSAAVVHGLDLIGTQPAAAVVVTRAPGGRGSRSLRGGVILHTAALPADHVVIRHGVRCTSVARTVVDLARTSSFQEGVVIADSALRAQLTSASELQTVLSDCARWPGIRRARDVVAFSDQRSESALESIGRAVFHELGLPAPDLQVWVGGNGDLIGRADYLWRRYSTIAEADGAVKYATPGRAIEQLVRDERLREAGFEVVHFTWQEIMTVPRQVAARVRAAFARGGRDRAGP